MRCANVESEDNGINKVERELLSIAIENKMESIKYNSIDKPYPYWLEKSITLNNKIDGLVLNFDNHSRFSDSLIAFREYLVQEAGFSNKRTKEAVFELITKLTDEKLDEFSTIKTLKLIEFIILDYYNETVIRAHFIFDFIEVKVIPKKKEIELNEEYQAEIIAVCGNENGFFGVIDNDTLDFVKPGSNILSFKSKPQKRGLNVHDGYLFFPDIKKNVQTKIPFKIEYNVN